MMKQVWLFILLGLSFNAYAQTQIELGENYFDISKAILSMEKQAPVYLGFIEKRLRDVCPQPALETACYFSLNLKRHAEAYADWRALAEPEDVFALSQILLRPRWNVNDVRAGLWNVNPEDRQAIAQLSSERALRFLASKIVVEMNFEAVADWLGATGSPYGSFQAVIRPVITAFLNSSDPLAQATSFGLSMKCREPNLACRAVRARLNLWLIGLNQDLKQKTEALRNKRFGDDRAARVFEENKAFQEYTRANWQEVAARLDEPGRLSELPGMKRYLDFLTEQAMYRKNLMPGRYSSAGEMLAAIVLVDLDHLIEQSAKLSPESENVVLSPASEEKMRQIENTFLKIYEPYGQAIDALQVELGPTS